MTVSTGLPGATLSAHRRMRATTGEPFRSRTPSPFGTGPPAAGVEGYRQGRTSALLLERPTAAGLDSSRERQVPRDPAIRWRTRRPGWRDRGPDFPTRDPLPRVGHDDRGSSTPRFTVPSPAPDPDHRAPMTSYTRVLAPRTSTGSQAGLTLIYVMIPLEPHVSPSSKYTVVCVRSQLQVRALTGLRRSLFPEVMAPHMHSPRLLHLVACRHLTRSEC